MDVARFIEELDEYPTSITEELCIKLILNLTEYELGEGWKSIEDIKWTNRKLSEDDRFKWKPSYSNVYKTARKLQKLGIVEIVWGLYCDNRGRPFHKWFWKLSTDPSVFMELTMLLLDFQLPKVRGVPLFCRIYPNNQLFYHFLKSEYYQTILQDESINKNPMVQKCIMILNYRFAWRLTCQKFSDMLLFVMLKDLTMQLHQKIKENYSLDIEYLPRLNIIRMKGKRIKSYKADEIIKMLENHNEGHLGLNLPELTLNSKKYSELNLYSNEEKEFWKSKFESEIQKMQDNMQHGIKTVKFDEKEFITIQEVDEQEYNKTTEVSNKN